MTPFTVATMIRTHARPCLMLLWPCLVGCAFGLMQVCERWGKPLEAAYLRGVAHASVVALGVCLLLAGDEPPPPAGKPSKQPKQQNSPAASDSPKPSKQPKQQNSPAASDDSPKPCNSSKLQWRTPDASPTPSSPQQKRQNTTTAALAITETAPASTRKRLWNELSPEEWPVPRALSTSRRLTTRDDIERMDLNLRLIRTQFGMHPTANLFRPDRARQFATYGRLYVERSGCVY